MVKQVGKVRWAAYQLKVEHLFAPRAKVTAVCWRCQEEKELDIVELAKFGRHTLLTRIEPKLRCRSCGMRAWGQLKIEWQL